MAGNNSGPRKPSGQLDGKKLDDVVAKAHKQRDTRMAGYREQSLKLHPWVCGRCGRSFTRENLHELTVHHKDHNHENNPPDGGNWELLCLYCHEYEHIHHDMNGQYKPADLKEESQSSTFKAFQGLDKLLGQKNKDPKPG